MKEIWKDIEGYEGLYMVSSLGRVKRLESKKCKHDRIITPQNNNGYFRVTLSKYGKVLQYRLHRLVAEAFIPNPNNYPVVNHKDENKQNNMIWVNEDGSIDYNKSNLEWCTQQYNCNYGGRTEKIITKLSKPVLQYNKEGKLLNEWRGTNEAAKKLNLNSRGINTCCLGKIKTSGGYIWKYK